MFKFLVLTLFISTISFADCYEKLTRGYQDSALFTQHSSIVYSNNHEKLDEQMAYNAIAKTLTDLECSTKIALNNIRCTDALNTTICRYNMKLGYFIVLKDYVDTVNILFNRWD